MANSPTVWCDEMIFYLQIFSTPCFHPKSKPFVDHILSFSIEDNRIWFRNFQVNTTLYYLSSTVFQGHELKECSAMIVVSSKFGFTVTLHQSALKLALRKGFKGSPAAEDRNFISIQFDFYISDCWGRWVFTRDWYVSLFSLFRFYQWSTSYFSMYL